MVKWISGERLGLQTHLAQNVDEQKFVNSLAVYSSNWIRIEFDDNELYTDDKFQGNIVAVTIWKLTLRQKTYELRSGCFWTLEWKVF